MRAGGRVKEGGGTLRGRFRVGSEWAGGGRHPSALQRVWRASGKLRGFPSGWLGLIYGVLVIAVGGCGGNSTKPDAAPTVTVLAPNGGENLQSPSAFTIQYSAQDADTPAQNLRITLEYSLDGGSTWSLIAQDDPNTGTFSWGVPGIATSTGKIRVTATDGKLQGSDTSDGTFTITTTPPPPQNSRLTVGDGTGAPGEDVQVTLSLNNRAPIVLLQTDLVFDPLVVDFSGAVVTGRGAAMNLTTTHLGAGTVRIVLAMPEGQSLETGTGVVATLTFSAIGADQDQTEVTPTETSLLDENNETLPVINEAGSIVVEATAEQLTVLGWTAFEAGDLTTALERFDSALAVDSQYGPARLGRGWCLLGTATAASDLTGAVTAFNFALEQGADAAESRAGRAAAELGLGGTSLAGAVTDAQAVLAASPGFVFSHRTSYDGKDLRLVVAFAEAGRGDFEAALNAADGIQNSGIQPDQADTWQVDGVTYSTFEAAVLAFLQKMSGQYSG